jgi:hypothetical protein
MPVDKSERVVKAQNSRAVFFTALMFRVVENRSSETLTVNQADGAPLAIVSGESGWRRRLEQGKRRRVRDPLIFVRVRV